MGVGGRLGLVEEARGPGPHWLQPHLTQGQTAGAPAQGLGEGGDRREDQDLYSQPTRPLVG